MHKLSRFLIYFLFFILSLAGIIFIRYYSAYNCFWGDDFEFSIYSPNEGIFDCLFGPNRLEHGGYYLGAFLCKFICFELPLLLHIHPSDFIIQLGFFNAFIFIIVALIAAKFIILNKKSLWLYFCGFCLFFCYSIYYGIFSDVFIVNYTFYRYFFSLLFYCTFWHYIYKQIINGNSLNNNTLQLTTACFCGFVTGTSVEITFISSAVSALFIIVYNAVISLFVKNNRKSLKFNLNKNFYLPVLFFFIGIILFTTTQGFREVSSSRGLDHIYLNWNLFKEFCKIFLVRYFADIYLYWILFTIILIPCVIFAIKKSELKKVVFPLILLIPVLIMIFSLVLCGKTFLNLYTPDGNFFIEHHNILYLYKMLILIPFLMIFGYFIKAVCYLQKSRKIKSVILTLFSALIFFGSITIIYVLWQSKEHIDFMREFMYVRRVNFYIAEKVLRFNYLKNQIPNLPIETCMSHKYFIDTDFSNMGIHTDNKLSLVYYKNIYKDNKAVDMGYKYSKDGLKKFYNDGGVFYEYELKDIKFSRLLKDDFVLNRNVSEEYVEKESSKCYLYD